MNNYPRNSPWRSNYAVLVGLLLTMASPTGIATAQSPQLLFQIDHPEPRPDSNFGQQFVVAGGIIAGSDTSRLPARPATDGRVYLFNAADGAALGTLENPHPAAINDFGISFYGGAMASTQNYLAIAAKGDDILPIGGERRFIRNAGAIYLFEKDSGALLRTFKNPRPLETELFGEKIAMSNEFVAATNYIFPHRSSANDYVEVFDVTSGELRFTLTNPQPQDHSGFGWALRAEGNFLFVSAPSSATLDGRGAIFLFDADTGNLRQTFIDPAAGFFGVSHAVMEDRLFVRNFDKDVHVFAIDSGELLHTITLPEGNPTFVSSDTTGREITVVGDKIAISSPTSGFFGDGHNARVYIYDSATYNLLSTLEHPITPTQPFGTALVALDDHRLLVGAPIGSGVAGAFVYDLSGLTDPLTVPEPTSLAVLIGLGILAILSHRGRRLRTPSFATVVVAVCLTNLNTVTVRAAVFDFSASFTNFGQPASNQFRLWLPDNVNGTGTRPVKGLIFLLPGAGGDWRSQVQVANLQNAADSLGFGLLGARAMQWGIIPGEERGVVQNVLDAAAMSSGRPEVANAPFSAMGFSDGGSWSNRIAAQIPERAISWVSIKGPNLSGGVNEARYVPGLYIAGQRDGFVGVGNRQRDWSQIRSAPLRPDCEDIFCELSSNTEPNLGAQTAFAVDWGTSHSVEGNQAWEAAWFWTGETIRLRYGDAQPLSTTPNNAPEAPKLETESGWLGQSNIFSITNQLMPLFPSSFAEIAPVAAGTFSSMRPLEASWLPSEAAAMVYRAYTSTDLVIRSGLSPRQGPLRILLPELSPQYNPGQTVNVAVDPRGMQLDSLDFFLDDQYLGTTTGGPSWQMDVLLPDPGIHAVVVVGRDAIGNQTSSFRTVIVARPIPEPSTAALLFCMLGIGALMQRHAAKKRRIHSYKPSCRMIMPRLIYLRSVNRLSMGTCCVR
jgi:hypothetical protein